MNKLTRFALITGSLATIVYLKRDEIFKYLTKKAVVLDQTVAEGKAYLSKVQTVKDKAHAFSAELEKATPVLDELSKEINVYSEEIKPLTKELDRSASELEQRFS